MKTLNIYTKTVLLMLFCSFGIVKTQAQITIGNDTTYALLDSVHLTPGVQSNNTIYQFPELLYKYERIYLSYQITCPPQGCDPWARIASVNVIKNNETFEIARIITPSDTGGCAWTIDVTDYRSLLAGNTNINTVIYTSFNGQIVHTSLTFVGGDPKYEAYRVQNLWGNGLGSRWEFGNPNNPIQNHIPTQTIATDPFSDSVRVKIVITGHGRGNTNDAAEYFVNEHMLLVNEEDTISHMLKSDCHKNVCVQPNNEWALTRSGWCPGDYVVPWDVSLVNFMTPGDVISLNYEIDDYENLCRPGANPCACPDCNYDGLGHTQPFYLMQSQLIHYRAAADTTNIGTSTLLNTEPNTSTLDLYPNPTAEQTTVVIRSISKSSSTIQIMDILGQLKKELNMEVNSGINKLDLDISDLDPGNYFVIATDNLSGVKKMKKLVIKNTRY